MDELETSTAGASVRSGPFSDNPRMPSDAGLPSLGLVMQLGAVLMLCLDLILMLLVLTPIMPGSRGYLLVLGFLGVVRSVVHWGAGARLSDAAIDALSRARTYLIVSVVHTLIVGVLMMVSLPGVGLSTVIYMALLLLAWPAVVTWSTGRGGVRQLFQSALQGEVELLGRNRGIEGAGVLMTALGIVGIILSVLFAYLLFQGNPMRAGFVGLLVVVFLLSLLVRSGFHTAAGVGSLRGASPGDFHNLVKRYVASSVASLILVAILGFVLIVQAGSPLVLLQFAIVAGMLGAWPFIMNGFATRAGGIFYLEEGAGGFGPAQDSGLTAVGYILLASGAFGVASGVGLLLVGGNPLGALTGFVGAQEGLSSAEWYLSIPSSVLTLWAGVELAQMSERFKLAATVYAIIAGALALWGLVDGIGMLGDMGGISRPQNLPGFVTIVAGMAVALVLPILTLVLAYRHRDQVLSLEEIFS